MTRFSVYCAPVFLLIFLKANLSMSICCYETPLDKPKRENSGDFPPQTFMNTEELIRFHGYPAETHKVLTEDGYWLTLHRIPHGRGEGDDTHREAVFLQHGILFSSAAWVIMGEENGLAFILADAGYDVWMGNFRGNVYSRGHVNKSLDSFDYWDFSWYEMAKYDLPAQIHYVLIESLSPKLMYIGHSTGANIFYIMCSLHPEYNPYIKAQFSLAPVTILDRSLSPVPGWGFFIELMTGWLQTLDVYEFMPNNEESQRSMARFCMNSLTVPICKSIFTSLGMQSNNYDEKTMALITAHFPAGTSTKAIMHYAQCINRGKYAEIGKFYNIFSFINYLINNIKWPKVYDLTLVEVPIYLYYALEDSISSEKEARILYDTLPNSKGTFPILTKSFRHLDFLWGKNAKTQLYQLLLEQMENHKEDKREGRLHPTVI